MNFTAFGKHSLLLLMTGLGCLSLSAMDTKGKILNDEGKPVIASITVKGTSRIISTDAEGNFTLIGISAQADLVISGLSFETTEIPVNGRTDLGIIIVKRKILEEAEVIVANTGYQKIRPNEINGSVVVLDRQDINRQVGTNILDRLNGITPGYLVNLNRTNRNAQNTTNITIRGLSTIKGALDPLIVLNGFIYDGSIDNINPNDVESVTILKDAAAASIWGARAGNGVIVITTRKGNFNQPVRISVSATVTGVEKPNLHTLSQMSSASYIDVEEFLFNKGYFDSYINTGYLAVTPAVEIFNARRNGLITAQDSMTGIDQLKGVDSRDDYEKYAYTRGITQQYAINLSGGSGNDAWTFSMAYDRALGSLRDKNHKWNIGIENMYRPLKGLVITAGAYYTNRESKDGLEPYGGARGKISGRSVPYLHLAAADGVPLSIPVYYRESYTDTAGSGKLLDWRYYPLRDYLDAPKINNSEELFANLGVQYRINSSFLLETKYQYQRQVATDEQVATLASYETRDLVNSFSQLDRQTGNIKYVIPLGGIHKMSRAIVASQTARVQLNYNHTWANHTINGIAGAEIRQSLTEGDQYQAYGYSTDPLYTSGADFVNKYPNFITGSQDGIPGPPFAYRTLYRFVSVYANASYIYKTRYSLSGSLRRDGSNIFGARTNDRWQPLGSMGAGWNIAKESFYKFKGLPVLRLRISYGVSGNVDLTKTAQPIATYYGALAETGFPIARITSLNNPRLKWEQSSQMNIGLDLATKNDRLSGSIEYYIKNGDQLYGETPYDYTGFGRQQEIIRNVAAIRGKGWDVNLVSHNLIGSFKWTTGYIFSYNSSKTTKYYAQNANNVAQLLGAGTAIQPVIGLPLYALTAYKWGGLDASGTPQGYLNGALSTAYDEIGTQANIKGLESGSLVYIGPGSPLFYGAFNNTVSWKGFSLSVNLVYKFSYYFMKPVLRYSSLVATGNGRSDFEDRWQHPGDETITSVPAFRYPASQRQDNFYSLAEIHAIKGDQVRLQYINFSYQFRKGTELYGNVSNLGLLWKANSEGLDPDYPGSVRPPRAWAFGIRSNF